MIKSVYFKFLTIALILLTSINADDIVGVWKVDKEKAISAIRNIVPEEERFLIERFIAHGLFKELDFKEDGVLVYPLVSDVNATWKYDKSKNVYLVKAAKDVGQIELSNKNNFVFKNILGKTNLDIDYKRIEYSEIRRKEIEDKIKIDSKIYTNRVYRSNMMIDSRCKKGLYHYIVFAYDNRFYKIEATLNDIEVTSLLDITKIIEEREKSEEDYIRSITPVERIKEKNGEDEKKSILERIKEKNDRDERNPIKGHYSSGYKIKDNNLIPTQTHASFGTIIEDPIFEEIPTGFRVIPRSKPCKEIEIVSRERLKCQSNGLEYFLLDVSK